MQAGRSVIRRGIVIFWAAWFAIVFLTNLCDGLKSFGLLPPQWAFASGNYEFMQRVVARSNSPHWLTAVLFPGVVLWEGFATALFFRAAHLSWTKSNAAKSVHSAFAAGLALWGAFALADEIFITYDVEAAHLRLFVAQLGSLLYLELVPDD